MKDQAKALTWDAAIADTELLIEHEEAATKVKVKLLRRNIEIMKALQDVECPELKKQREAKSEDK